MNDKSWPEYTLEKLFMIVCEEDTKQLEAGLDATVRRIQTAAAVRKRLDLYSSAIPGLIEPTKTFDDLDVFEKIDYLCAALVEGVRKPIVFRGSATSYDLAFPVDIPFVFGKTAINIFDYVGANEFQIHRAMRSQKFSETFLTSVCDSFDIGAALAGYLNFCLPDGVAGQYVKMASAHCQAAGQVFRTTRDFRNTIYLCQISIELTMKSLFLANALSEREVKEKYGHDLKKMSRDTGEIVPKLGKVFQDAAQNSPDFVSFRYSGTAPSASEALEVLFLSQRALSERLISYSGHIVRPFELSTQS